MKILVQTNLGNRHPLSARGQENFNLLDSVPKNLRKQASTLGQRPRKLKFARFWSQKTSENGLPLLARGQENLNLQDVGPKNLRKRASNLNLQRRNDQAYIASNGDLSSKMQTFSRLNRPRKMAYTGGSYRS